MDEVLDYFDTKGFGVTFNPTCPTGRGTHVDALNGQEVFEARRQILERADRSDNLMILGPDLVRQLFCFVTQRRDMTERNCNAYNCGAGVTLIGVDPDGNLWPCGRSNDADMGKFGNVHDVASLGDYQKKLTAFHEKDLWYVRCFGCAARIICPFGCTAFDKESLPTREMDCSATRLLHQYLCSHDDLAQRLVERVQVHMRKMDKGPTQLPPPFLEVRAGHPCGALGKGDSSSADAEPHRACAAPNAT
jgi:radical SAM protein with 4Fe4S-binding SPASM domain